MDNKGEILWGDQTLILLARDVLKTHPGATIIADVKASQVLFDEVARAGGKPLMWRTGHSLIKSKMAETGSPLAGEMSGHIFFADKWYGFDDALYGGVRALDILARMDEPLSVFRESLPKTISTPEVRFDCDDHRKFKVIEEVAERLRKAGADVSEIDGVRVNTSDGWWLLRAPTRRPCWWRGQKGATRLVWNGSKRLWWCSLKSPACPARIFRVTTPGTKSARLLWFGRSGGMPGRPFRLRRLQNQACPVRFEYVSCREYMFQFAPSY